MNRPEVTTRSIPTAGMLILLGHTPIGVVHDHSGSGDPAIRFSPDAVGDLKRWQAAKTKAEQFIQDAK